MAVMSSDLIESIIETLDILGTAEATAALRESIEDLKRGRLVERAEVAVAIVLAGLRKARDKRDVYALAKKLLKQGLLR